MNFKQSPTEHPPTSVDAGPAKPNEVMPKETGVYPVSQAQKVSPAQEVSPAQKLDTEAVLAAEWIHLPNLPPVACPCGTARRGFAGRQDFPGTVHLTEIAENARAHFHRRQTEVYVILECDQDACVELNGQARAVEPLTAILIPPGVVHRAVGKMKVLIYCTPKFDPSDEFFPD